MILKPKYLTPVFGLLDTEGVNEVPIPAGALFASQIFDRRLTPTFAEMVTISVAPMDDPYSGDIDVWVYHDPGPSGSGNESAWVSGQVAYANEADPKWVLSLDTLSYATVKKAGTFQLDAASYGTTIFTFNVAPVFDGMIPPRFAVILHNKTVSDLRGFSPSGMIAWCQVVGVQAEAT